MMASVFTALLALLLGLLRFATFKAALREGEFNDPVGNVLHHVPACNDTYAARPQRSVR